MSAMSDYLETALINHLFRGTAMSAPSTLYIGLFTSAPSDSGGGTEVSGNNYARASYTCSTSNWAATSGGNGQTSNSNTITFNTPSGSWGTVVAFGIFDAATAGNLLFHGSLSQSKTVNSGDAPSFQAGQLQITLA